VSDVDYPWTAKSRSVPDGRRIQIYGDDAPLSFREYLNLLQQDGGFHAWYAELLRGTAYDAFFWEHPPLKRSNLDSQAEFVLIDSPALARIDPDPSPFRSHFRDDAEIVAFPSLGGDALLIAPAPREPLIACAHLASFVRNATASQVQDLWREVGRAMREAVSNRNLWLSTSGLGVSWLHVRLDSYPKYYQHRPYAETG